MVPDVFVKYHIYKSCRVVEIHFALSNNSYDFICIYLSEFTWVKCDTNSSHVWMDLDIALKGSENQHISNRNVYNESNIYCNILWSKDNLSYVTHFSVWTEYVKFMFFSESMYCFKTYMDNCSCYWLSRTKSLQIEINKRRQ